MVILLFINQDKSAETLLRGEWWWHHDVAYGPRPPKDEGFLFLAYLY